MNTNNITVGISISEPDAHELGRLGFGLVHLQDRMVETARFLLSKGYNLAYGGDLNYDGPFNFTNLLFQLGMTYGGLENRITNYVAFPMYPRISPRRKAELIKVARMIPVNPSREFDGWLSLSYDDASLTDKQYLDDILDCKTDQAKQVWEESLTQMRKEMTRHIQFRIVMGGKTENYKGRMPGVIEETILCLQNDISVIIDGSFGGAALQIIENLQKPERTNNLNSIFRESLSSVQTKALGKNKVLLPGSQSMDDINKYFMINQV